MPHIKSIALWSFGVILLGAIAIVAFLTIAGDDFYRWMMRQAIEGTIDREIRAEGSFSFSVGLEPSVTVTDVWLENAPWANTKEMARAERVEVQIALLPLFSGIVHVPRLVVEGLDVALERSSDGRGNWVFGSARPDEREEAIDEDVTFPLFGLVSLKDVAVTYRGHQDGQDMELLLDFLDKRQDADEVQLGIRHAQAEERPHRDGAERARLQSDPGHEHHRHPPADTGDGGLGCLVSTLIAARPIDPRHPSGDHRANPKPQSRQNPNSLTVTLHCAL